MVAAEEAKKPFNGCPMPKAHAKNCMSSNAPAGEVLVVTYEPVEARLLQVPEHLDGPGPRAVTDRSRWIFRTSPVDSGDKTGLSGCRARRRGHFCRRRRPERARVSLFQPSERRHCRRLTQDRHKWPERPEPGRHLGPLRSSCQAERAVLSWKATGAGAGVAFPAFRAPALPSSDGRIVTMAGAAGAGHRERRRGPTRAADADSTPLEVACREPLRRGVGFSCPCYADPGVAWGSNILC